jgi:hypothetical protein
LDIFQKNDPERQISSIEYDPFLLVWFDLNFLFFAIFHDSASDCTTVTLEERGSYDSIPQACQVHIEI